MIFVRYRKDAHRTLDVARDEARALRHNYIGTEHLLLALTVGELDVASRVLAECGVTETGLKQQVIHELEAASDALTDTDAQALASVGIDLDEVRRHVEQSLGPAAFDNPPPCLTGTRLTDKALHALRSTSRHARRLGHRNIGPEHLLLALMDDESALSSRLVQRLGTTPKDLRARTLAAITSL